MNNVIQRFTKNRLGKDYVCADIHGNRTALEEALQRVNFNSKVDRLFVMGDLIDRGSDNQYILDFFKNPFANSTRGNHEDMLLNRIHVYFNGVTDVSYKHAVEGHEENGGRWFSDIEENKMLDIRNQLLSLPFAIELEAETGAIGLVHGEVDSLDWSSFVDSLNNSDSQMNCIWGRNQASLLKRFIKSNSNNTLRKIKGISAVVHGHTLVSRPMASSNRVFLDTGLVTGKISIFEVNDLIEKASHTGNRFLD